MRSFQALSLLTLLASVWATAVEDVSTETLDTGSVPPECSGVLVLVARGTDSQAHGTTINPKIYSSYPTPLSSVVAAATSAGGPGSTFSAIPYPASTDYKASLRIGIMATQQMIQDWVNKCQGKSKIVLTGYSQGAQVMSSALGGGAGLDGLQASLRKYIVAGAFIADPSRLYPATVDYNGPGSNGAPAATMDGDLKIRYKNQADQNNLNNNFGTVVKSFCEAGDNICGELVAGPTGANSIHKTETQTWQTQAIDFIQPLITNAVGG